MCHTGLVRFGLSVPAFADFAEPAALADLARTAEAAGWDGFFVWDHVVFDPTFHPMADPWVALAAVALATERVRIGTLVTPLPRRRPWKVARETVSLDRLSGGRLVLGVGIGDPVQWEFGWFGEPTEAKHRGAMLDEGLAILDGLWSGEPFAFSGAHYRLERMRFLPRPVQQPRIPVWVAGWWPNKPPLRRAARWDGVLAGTWGAPFTPDDLRDLVAYVMRHRTATTPFEVVASGHTPGDDPASARAQVAPYAAAGATWWIEGLNPWRWGASWEESWPAEGTARMRQRVEQGPPRLQT